MNGLKIAVLPDGCILQKEKATFLHVNGTSNYFPKIRLWKLHLHGRKSKYLKKFNPTNCALVLKRPTQIKETAKALISQ